MGNNNSHNPLAGGFSLSLIAVGVAGVVGAPATDWQLPVGNYVPAKMSMTVVHPRPEIETNDWARYRNAYPDIRYEIPIAIQGGAYPFLYEIVSGPAGMTIGERLIVSGDELVRPDGYGVLNWESPVTGVHSVQVRVTDQDLNTVDVSFSVTVGVSGWLFIDPVNGNDTTGTGLIAAPFKTIEKITNDSVATTTYSGSRVYLRAGTTALDGMSANNGNLRFENDNNPLVWLGYPDEAAILEAYEGWIILAGGNDDFYMGDLTYQYAAGYSPGGGVGVSYMVSTLGASDRIQYQNVTFKDYKGDPANVGSGNSSVLYFSSVARNYISITNCYGTGVLGSTVDSYQWNYSVIDGFDIHDATLQTSDGSSRALFFIKDNPDHVTLRNIRAVDNNTWDITKIHGGIGIYGQNGATNTEISYCTVDSPHAVGRIGAATMWGFNTDAGLIENIWMYRNSFKQKFLWEGGSSYTNFAAGTEVHENMILDTGTLPIDPQITNIGNLDAGTYFDASMKLVGQSRIDYLGTKGAEVASGISSWVGDVGLLWDDGIEPVESTLYPLASGKRIWYVDLDAGVNGNGDEGTPLNHFTDLVGWFDGVNYHQGTLGFVGGDQIWITGTATPAKHSLGVTDMRIEFRRDNQYGTKSEPTVIRSWKGQNAALFDGEYTDSLGIAAVGQTEVGNSIVVLNVQGTRSLSMPVSIGDVIENITVRSCYCYFNYALNGGPASSYGGIVVDCANGLRNIEVSNNKVHDNNTSDGVTVQASNNIGGISLLNQATADPLSTVVFKLNRVYNENYAIRHKHSGVGTFESTNNILSDSNSGHYIRNAGINNIHHNIVYDMAVNECVLEAENQSQERTVNYYNNTVSRCPRLVGTSSTENFQNILSISRNIYYNPTYMDKAMIFGQYGSSNYDLSNTSSDNNIFVIGDEALFWINNGGASVSLATYQSTIPDSTSITSDPLFTDADNNDYTLLAGSPAINLNGVRVGAL